MDLLHGRPLHGRSDMPPPSDAPANALANAGKPPSFYARTELGAFEMPLQSHAEWLDFLTLTLADWLEQVEGASSKAVPRPIGDGVLWRKGEAWGYRREAYAGMAQILAAHGVEAAPIMYNEVFWERARMVAGDMPAEDAAYG